MAALGSHRSAVDVVPGQQRFDVWAWGERWNDVAEDVHVSAEILEDLFQVLLLFVGALEIGVLVLLRDDEHVHHEAVPHSVEDALADGLLALLNMRLRPSMHSSAYPFD